MTLDHHLAHEFAHALIDARRDRSPIKPLTNRAPHMTSSDAYAIAADILSHELERGCRIVGRKVGFTNRDIQEKLGVRSPNFGTLLDDMTVRTGGRIRASSLISPMVEPEIAFRLKAPLRGPGVTIEDVIAATDYVFPALEIVDSRFEDWRFQEPDATADNACAAKVVIGAARLPPSALDLADEEVAIYRNSNETHRAKSSTVLGNPASAVAWCANKLAELGAELRAGEFVMTGSIAGVTPAAPGDAFHAEFASLGAVSVRFT